ncbi:MAG: hypothetical protein COW19_06635 [Zetaproteobacteria bacterium CG12_big_fil_rev_8_21_14_0_65_55_1124]|nr:MAG: hypothetical protein AUJ58_05305 [Zetaproteobacteria bacterium CG1_02_55_237]PIS20182.1 MAG: hypothetical protein COT53_01995 [Zetaproteobacteria bacterium CG08_land_8_20_14_0_20_55_17]PIW42696.1 MAG: hypothetical protein COW19_06635 [Zetaproteobacteria bacterium CG12_big_fil_rev_8_21_14_0_65_55_1124]PIY53710.1 MAG: hypothetical protein COZ01_02760 [Zetaproteobacteria bacterium CG_4_10_14_0_8_um_filter_55_43]PIZ38829.1 MAG: hypothetical protein COY36_05055 [Zetaproteobacteria bacterium 
MRKLLLVFLFLILPPGMAWANDGNMSTRAERLMAVYVYNFTRYTNWPEGNADHTATPHMATRLAVLGRSPFGPALDEVASKSPAESKLLVSYCRDMVCAQDSDAVFFVAGSMSASSIRMLLTAWSGKPLLTISDMPGFADMGGMIELQRSKGRLTFRINMAVAGKANLHISSQLLQLGEVVGIKP